MCAFRCEDINAIIMDVLGVGIVHMVWPTWCSLQEVNTMEKSKVQKWKISRLKKHPLQETMFGDLPDAELRALAEDMRVNKQKDPVEILPDGTVLAGHQRIRAARLLGWPEGDGIIRQDRAE